MRVLTILALSAFGVSCNHPTDPFVEAETEASAPSSNLSAYFDCIDAEGKTIISAHRGGPDNGFPENALETLQRTAAATGALLEVDVATSQDGVLFLHHDDTLDRTTSGSGIAEDATWDDLRKLSLKDKNGRLTAFGLARLDDTLKWADGKAILQLDIKRSTDYDDLAEVVRAAGAEDRIVVIGYTEGQVRALASRFPNTMISAPVNAVGDLTSYQDSGVKLSNILAWTGTRNTQPGLYAELDDQNVEVIFGTLGGRTSIDKDIASAGNDNRYLDIVNDGVDVLATDRPFAAMDVLAASNKSVSPGLCRA